MATNKTRFVRFSRAAPTLGASPPTAPEIKYHEVIVDYVMAWNVGSGSAARVELTRSGDNVTVTCTPAEGFIHVATTMKLYFPFPVEYHPMEDYTGFVTVGRGPVNATGTVRITTEGRMEISNGLEGGEVFEAGTNSDKPFSGGGGFTQDIVPLTDGGINVGHPDKQIGTIWTQNLVASDTITAPLINAQNVVASGTIQAVAVGSSSEPVQDIFANSVHTSILSSLDLLTPTQLGSSLVPLSGQQIDVGSETDPIANVFAEWLSTSSIVAPEGKNLVIGTVSNPVDILYADTIHVGELKADKIVDQLRFEDGLIELGADTSPESTKGVYFETANSAGGYAGLTFQSTLPSGSPGAFSFFDASSAPEGPPPDQANGLIFAGTVTVNDSLITGAAGETTIANKFSLSGTESAILDAPLVIGSGMIPKSGAGVNIGSSSDPFAELFATLVTASSIVVSSDVTPADDSKANLGTSLLRFANVYTDKINDLDLEAMLNQPLLDVSSPTFDDLGLTGNLSVGESLGVRGDAEFDQSLLVGGVLTINNEAKLNGGVSVTGNSTVTGNSSVTGVLTANGKAELKGGMDLIGNGTVTGDLAVSGEAKLDSGAAITGDVAVTGDVTVTGTSIVAGSFLVTEDVTIHGDATLNGLSTVNGNLVITGRTTATLQFTTNEEAKLNGGAAITGNLSVSGGATVSGVLTTSSEAKLNGGAVIAGTLKTTNEAKLNGGVAVTGNASVTGDFTANGTINGLDLASLLNQSVLNTSTPNFAGMHLTGDVTMATGAKIDGIDIDMTLNQAVLTISSPTFANLTTSTGYVNSRKIADDGLVLDALAGMVNQNVKTNSSPQFNALSVATNITVGAGGTVGGRNLATDGAIIEALPTTYVALLGNQNVAGKTFTSSVMASGSSTQLGTTAAPFGQLNLKTGTGVERLGHGILEASNRADLVLNSNGDVGSQLSLGTGDAIVGNVKWAVRSNAPGGTTLDGLSILRGPKLTGTAAYSTTLSFASDGKSIVPGTGNLTDMGSESARFATMFANRVAVTNVAGGSTRGTVSIRGSDTLGGLELSQTTDGSVKFTNKDSKNFAFEFPAGFNGAVVPQLTQTTTLGNDANRWGGLFLKNGNVAMDTYVRFADSPETNQIWGSSFPLAITYDYCRCGDDVVLQFRPRDPLFVTKSERIIFNVSVPTWIIPVNTVYEPVLLRVGPSPTTDVIVQGHVRILNGKVEISPGLRWNDPFSSGTYAGWYGFTVKYIGNFI